MRRFGLIGFPLTHSFSKKYFTEKFAQLGLADCVYENYSLKQMVELGAILQNQDISGFNITIPYKKQVMAYLSEATEVVTAIGACNCVQIKNGKLIGHNTDVFGFEQSLLSFLKPHHTKALVLGTGGASAAVKYVLEKLGLAIQFVSREATPNSISYQMLDESIISSHTLIINTSPVGMYPTVDDYPAIPFEYITSLHHLYDLIYNPTETTFLAKGRALGASIQNGQEMLVLQAEESWRIWNS